MRARLCFTVMALASIVASNSILAADGGNSAESSVAPHDTPAAIDAFQVLPGRWTGEGRLGFKDGKIETVTCRATYFQGDETRSLKQNIRCASPSGKIEVRSTLSENNGVLAGQWTEEIYNLAGELSGEVTPAGLKVAVKGEGLDANMDLIVRGHRQVVEIQFHNTTLIGLTLILSRTDQAGGPS